MHISNAQLLAICCPYSVLRRRYYNTLLESDDIQVRGVSHH